MSRLEPDAIPGTDEVWGGFWAAERFADGRLRPDELAAAYNLACDYSNYKRWLEYALSSTGRDDAWNAADQTFMSLRDFVDEIDHYSSSPDAGNELEDLGFWSGARQAVLLRDIFGNPYRPAALDPAWLTADVRALAQGIYDERAFDRMPILADALQDAGCDNDAILTHCRDAAQVHVRGCWVVDLLLGKS